MAARKKNDMKPNAKYVVSIEHDPDTDNPCEDGDGRWQFYSFSRRHNNFKDPEEFQDEDGKLLPELKAKLESGLAFMLSYYEHGLCRWSLSGHGPQCQWDSVQIAGIAVWEEPEENIGGKTYEERQKDVEGALEEYTEWCNGNCYYFRISHANNDYDKKGIGEEIESCGGVIGSEWIAEAIQEAMPEDATPENTRIIGEAKDSISYHNIFPKTPA